jgi:hypothetical protein
MTTLSENIHRAASYIVSEASGFRSREQVLLAAASGVLLAGAVLAAKVVPADATATASADAGNTASSGTIAMDGTAPIASTAKKGRYVGVSSAATKVNWEDPDGVAIGVSTHGTAFTRGGIKFTITAGGTPNVVGDKFYVDVDVEKDDVRYVPFDPAGTDGSEVARAILYEGRDASGSDDVRCVITARDTEVQADMLVWIAGVTSAQKSAALASLAASGIIGR